MAAVLLNPASGMFIYSECGGKSARPISPPAETADSAESFFQPPFRGQGTAGFRCGGYAGEICFDQRCAVQPKDTATGEAAAVQFLLSLSIRARGAVLPCQADNSLRLGVFKTVSIDSIMRLHPDFVDFLISPP